ncbi:uncharacterized protein LOC108703849 [Xenopus laevis]|uniref:Uncharacterized protein LOC108703849 n=1 Tax=Xenopus laevis TaxID=8355 RepID=A0A8J1LSI9_XENLA|nr:uncharacterized protein LOC108703849 [Xenopus laevis]
MESEEQLQETRGGSGRSSERSEEPHKYHKYSMLDYREVPKLLRLESEVTDTSCKKEIIYLRIDRDTDMRSEINRCQSFSKCNNLYPAPIASMWSLLSQAGFYYVGPGDRVRCFSCGGELENWEFRNDPLTRHQLSFPDCPYVLELRARAEMSTIFGQSQTVSASERLSPTVPSSSNCPTVHGQIKDPDYSKVESITEGESETPAPPSGSSISGQKPLRTMRDKHNRLETYRRHRHHFPHNNQRSLSQAGFYYVGPGDRVRCFSCAGELENWQPGDVPLTRHQLSFPDCPYVLELEAKRPMNLSTELNEYLSYMTPFHMTYTGERLSSVTHCDKSDHTDQEEGLSGPIKEGASGQVEEEISGQVEDGAIGQVGKGLSGKMEVGASGQVEEGISDQVVGGASGQVEVEPRVQKEETCDWPTGSAEECELCGKIPEVPRISPQRSGTKYRLVVPGEGLFRCSETGLQFRVESPANIDIEIGSWVEFLEHLQQYTYDIVGPLFNITVKSGRVSAVYLPHYVCLKGGDVDTAMFRVAHYKDDNMILESPTKVEPFYVVLENPTFSPVWVIMLQPSPNGNQRNTPTHGVVLLYSRYKTGYTIHLYLMPHDLSLKQAVHNKETENGFYRVDKPPRTSTIYAEKIYIVGGPEDADIIPEELELYLDFNSELYPYSEIYLKEIQDNIYLKLTCQGENTSTWRTQLRTEDLEIKTKVTEDGRHFIDQHRAALIANMSHIDPVLDDLLDNEILTQEQYDTVRSKSTSQEKMRQLYDCIKTWGNADKNVFYFTLSVHNKSLIKELLHS